MVAIKPNLRTARLPAAPAIASAQLPLRIDGHSWSRQWQTKKKHGAISNYKGSRLCNGE